MTNKRILIQTDKANMQNRNLLLTSSLGIQIARMHIQQWK